MAAEMRDDCEALAVALANAKRTEDEAKKARIEAEEKLAAALGGKSNGSSSFSCGCLKVTVKRGYSYSVENIETFASKFPEFVKTKTELNSRAYEEAIRSGCTEATEYVTVKPKKVAVEIKM